MLRYFIHLSLSQFINVLETLLELKSKQKFLSHQDLMILFDDILKETGTAEHSDKWIQNISNIINQ